MEHLLTQQGLNENYPHKVSHDEKRLVNGEPLTERKIKNPEKS